ncbi:MAG TPA: hypothetical protein VGS19_01570 [Streptosporangiaceae bacterium]|nr:hypothetical protein [Streptosporangiaceae bacterium]
MAKIADLVALGRGDDTARRNARSVGAAWPGWDHGAMWDDASGRPVRVWEPSAWRRERRRRLMWERELAEGGRPVPVDVSGWWPRRAWLRVRYGRPLVLAARVVVVAGVPLVAQVSAPGDPAVPALAVGAFTWLVLTGRLDLAPGHQGQSR